MREIDKLAAVEVAEIDPVAAGQVEQFLLLPLKPLRREMPGAEYQDHHQSHSSHQSLPVRAPLLALISPRRLDKNNPSTPMRPVKGSLNGITAC